VAENLRENARVGRAFASDYREKNLRDNWCERLADATQLFIGKRYPQCVVVREQ